MGGGRLREVVVALRELTVLMKQPPNPVIDTLSEKLRILFKYFMKFYLIIWRLVWHKVKKIENGTATKKITFKIV